MGSKFSGHFILNLSAGHRSFVQGAGWESEDEFSLVLLVEAAGIEPASENVPLENLHTCQVPIWSYPGLKEPASQPGHQPIEYRPSPPGQQLGAILSKVTPFNGSTGEPVKDVAGY